MKIVIVEFKNSHIPEMWEIMKEYSDYISDDVDMDSVDKFEKFLKIKVRDILVGIRKNRVVGFGYIESMHDGMARFAVLVKKKVVFPQSNIDTLKSLVPYYFRKYKDLRMLYAVTKFNNSSGMRLLDELGFSHFRFLKNYRTIKNNDHDYFMASILRERALGGT